MINGYCLHEHKEYGTIPDKNGTYSSRCRDCGQELTRVGNYNIDANRLINNYKPGEAKKVIKTDKKPYGYWNNNKDAILKDIADLGAEAALKKWGMKESTWLSCQKRWKAGKYAPAKKECVKSCDHPCPEILVLRGYRQAVQDLGKIPALNR